MLGPYLFGITGFTLNADDKRRLASPEVGGVILFGRNFESPAQVADLVQHIRAACPEPKPVFVDHEGGRVQRFRTGFTAIPAMRSLGNLAGKNLPQALKAARAAGFVLASELRACGLDMSFTPVLDLDWGNSEIIGDRAFSANAERVGLLAAALMNGLLLAGMQACGKHFPGHGWVKLDSHLALPRDTRPLSDLRQHDLQPYAHNNSLNMAAIMPAHVVYDQVDTLPACFSPFWLEEELRGRLNYDGAIISDDLDMVGAHSMGGIAERAAAALQAGCDAVLVCNTFADMDTLLTSQLAQAQPNAQRHRRLQRLLAQPVPCLQNWQQLQALPDYQAALATLELLRNY